MWVGLNESPVSEVQVVKLKRRGEAEVIGMVPEDRKGLFILSNFLHDSIICAAIVFNNIELK